MKQKKKPLVYRGGPGLSPSKQRKLLHNFALDITATKTRLTTGANKNTVNLFYRKCRKAIYSTFSRAPKLSGNVEIDIAEFGGRGRKKVRLLGQKYARILSHFDFKEKMQEIRSRYKTRVLVFAERGGRVYAHVIRSKKADDLLPLIRLVIEKGSTIYSDEEPGFSRLKEDGYTHHTFVSTEFRTQEDRDIGAHTANADAFISAAKERLRSFKGMWKHTVALHIKECVWRYNLRDSARDRHGMSRETLLRIERELKSLLKNPPL